MRCPSAQEGRGPEGDKGRWDDNAKLESQPGPPASLTSPLLGDGLFLNA